MKYLLLQTAVFAALLICSNGVYAQDKVANAPLFITPYTSTVPTRSTNMPRIVTSAKGTRTYTTANRVSKPMYTKNVNQFPADFGRITSEQDFYDSQTGKYHGQYDYFALLAKRGDTDKLQQALNKVQSKGVFDPAKYEAVMNSQSSDTNTSGASTVQRMAPVQRLSTVVTRQNKTVTPKRVHQGYDDDMSPETDTQPTPRKNAPIFLR